MKSLAMSKEWTEVFAGPRWKAEILRSELEIENIDAFIPDLNLKTVDPFLACGNVFDFKLLVRNQFATRAKDIVGTPRPEEYEERPTESLSEPRVDAAMTALESQGRRIRWSAIEFVFAPVGVWLSAPYIKAASKHSPRPAGHRWTLFAIAICAIECTLLVGACVLAAAGFFGLDGLFEFLRP